jgi:predicted O-methyltransferase YrrM
LGLYVIIAVLALALAASLWKLKNYREDRKKRGLLKPWPVRQIGIDEFDPRFKPGRLGPDPATEIRFVAGFHVDGGISDFETWILCTLAKDAKTIFELGTCTGKTTYLLAANAPADARVITLTLAPDQLAAYKAGEGDDREATEAALAESAYAEFYYSGRPEAAKITQLFGDSKAFDETPYLGQCDLVFVDGSHARSYVESDSRKALAMVKPGGVVFWHDYHGPRRAKGVFQALNDLSRTLPLAHIRGTALVGYRKPAG